VQLNKRQIRGFNSTGIILASLCLLCTPLHVQAEKNSSKAPVKKAPVKAVKSFRDCSTCPRMVVVPAGRFVMGSPADEDGRGDDEGPQHQVNIASFALSATEITRDQFSRFANKTKYKAGDTCWTMEEGVVKERQGDWRRLSASQAGNLPIGCIGWQDARAYAKWISRVTGKRYRLPTEAEWEYAARGKTSTARYWGDDPGVACSYANVADQTVQKIVRGATSWSVHKCSDGFVFTSPVGSFKPNAFGLYDMLGNVWEWTEDSYHDSYASAPADGAAWLGDNEMRVLRGGSWNNAPRNSRSAVRNSCEPERRFNFFGIRLARSIP
jgi:formylglycine-generating enzyme required for sulfatase activity